IIPAVAGMMGMKPTHFILVNVLSALLWAPAYLLPGMAFGTSLAIAGQVAGRLAILLLALLLVLWLAFWLVRRVYRFLQPRAAMLAMKLLGWGQNHPLLGRLSNALLDPQVPPPQALFILALLLLGGAWLAFSLVIYAGPYAQLSRIDQGIAHLFSSLRTPWGDHLMVFLSQLGDAPIIISLAAVIVGLLAWQRRWRELRYWLAALAFTAAELLFLRQIGSLGEGAHHAPLVQSVIVYGFLAVFASQELRPQWRWLPYAWAVLLMCAIALARLYLGAIRLSDLLGDLGLGGAWLIVLGIAYHRHLGEHRAIPYLPLTIILTLTAASGWYTAFSHDKALQRHALQPTVQRLQVNDWWQDAWRYLPAFRIDLGGDFEQPLNMQWAGDLETLHTLLEARSWREPPPLSVTSALHWLLPDSALASLPMLPQLHEGRHQSLLLVRPLGGRQQLVLRLWPADVVLRPDGIPLWIGTVARLDVRRIGFFTLPVTGTDFDAPLDLLEEDVSMLPRRRARRSLRVTPELQWRGEVLLLREPG
ncbi:MAG: LssY C-terminal domain-containing protein, partial [Gammaproteobacteria bacterium]